MKVKPQNIRNKICSVRLCKVMKLTCGLPSMAYHILAVDMIEVARHLP